jgi:hypothetical protein
LSAVRVVRPPVLAGRNFAPNVRWTIFDQMKGRKRKEAKPDDAGPARKKRRAQADDAGGDGAEGDDGVKEREAEEWVSEMTVAVTGIPEPTTLLGMRNVTRGALVRFAAIAPIGPAAESIKRIRSYPAIWRRSVCPPSHAFHSLTQFDDTGC